MKDDYLIVGLNAVASSLTPVSGFPDVEIFCQTMRKLLLDKQRLYQIHAAINLRNFASDSLAAPPDTEDATRFRELIWELSQRDPHVLAAAGVHPFIAGRLLSDVDRLIDLLTTPRDVNFDVLHGRVSEVTEDVCRLSEKPALMARRYSSLLKILGGGTIVVTNAAADTLLGGPVGALSQSAGGGLFWDGLKGWPRD